MNGNVGAEVFTGKNPRCHQGVSANEHMWIRRLETMNAFLLEKAPIALNRLDVGGPETGHVGLRAA
jgi:hypothetical protein